MPQLGIHALVFVTGWSEAEIAEATAGATEAGYDLIEAVIFDPAKGYEE